MQGDDASREPEALVASLARLAGALTLGLYAVESAAQQLDPSRFDALRERLRPPTVALEAARSAFCATSHPHELDPLWADLEHGAAELERALRGLLEPAPPSEAAARVLGALSAHCRAQETLYPLRRVVPPLGRYFAEPATALDRLDPDPPEGLLVGLHRARGGTGPEARGGFSLYVPEHATADRALPLVVALHGGFGSGHDFLWTWLREARSRGFLLLAPSSRGTTWSLDAPELDGRALRRMVEFVAERWPLDRERILLTGLSDGATFALLTGLHPEAPYSALAPIAGVLHPANFALGNLERARGRRIYQVHGERDWLFPVALAHMARDALAGAGADLVYRELPELSHAYPRDENARILAWFDPGLEPVGR